MFQGKKNFTVSAIDPQDVWKNGLHRFALGGWAILQLIGLESIFHGVGIALNKGFGSLGEHIILAIAAGACVFGMWAWAKSIEYAVKQQNYLHWIFHETREKFHTLAVSVNEHPTNYKNEVNKWCECFLTRLAQHYTRLINDGDCGAAIRLAEIVNGQEFYVTRARANLSPTRDQKSQPLPSGIGIASIVRSATSPKAYIVNDIQKAIDAGIWIVSETDKLPDVKHVMVAPINGYVNGAKSTLGILCVTSVNKCFSDWHAIGLFAFADFLGTMLPVILSLEPES